VRAVGVAPERLEVIPNGADTARFHPGLRAAHRAGVLRALDLPDDGLLAAFAGREFGRKGLREVIQALAATAPTVRLLVAGDPVDRPGTDWYRDLATRLGVADRVRFLGHVTDLERWLGAADVFVFPTAYEANPLVVNEALACGVPVIATAANGIADRVREGIDGFLVPADPGAIAAALEVLRRDPARRERMSEAAAAGSRAYDWDAIAARYAAMYERVREARPA